MNGGNTMKTFIAAAAVVVMLAANICAAEGGGEHHKISPERLETMKTKVVAAIEHKIAILQKEKQCMLAVQAREDYRKCRADTKKAWAEYIEHGSKK
jgi:hypothetical protein